MERMWGLWGGSERSVPPSFESDPKDSTGQKTGDVVIMLRGMGVTDEHAGRKQARFQGPVAAVFEAFSVTLEGCFGIPVRAGERACGDSGLERLREVSQEVRC